ncbi:MAG: hypothetical protein A2283_07875 [Lentisphaerae bacterium RIFOXYA12_FULL_48_11]|nr:MAG: hypothetical protein A2283_07875 [Lentisphaerae bacterium RIFOXYA12_FULL_48_11]
MAASDEMAPKTPIIPIRFLVPIFNFEYVALIPWLIEQVWAYLIAITAAVTRGVMKTHSATIPIYLTLTNEGNNMITAKNIGENTRYTTWE